MTFDELKNISDETARISAVYEIFDENARLNHSKAARVEFLTTVRLVEKYLPEGGKILDIGAGAGEYSLYFAKKGFNVTAVELADANINAFKEKLTPSLGRNLNLMRGNACDLSAFADESFDIVLLLGPLYHLSKSADRERCINEAKRVCKPDGMIFFAFISNDMVILTEMCYSPSYLTSGDYNHDTFKLEDFPFVFFTVDRAREMLAGCGVKIISEVASDGVSELLAEKINAMDDETYSQYLKYHYYCSEKPEMLGRSNHLLFVGKK